MNTTIIEHIPVSSLFPDRYGLGKTKVYEYLKDLDIKPFKQGKQAFITLEQLQALDRYANMTDAERSRLKAGTNGNGQVHEPVHGLVHNSHELVHEPVHELDWQWMIEAIARQLAQAQPDPLALHRQLEEIAQQQWVVNSSQLKAIVGHFPVEGSRYGFLFQKAGKQGREMGWTIKKGS